MDFHGKTFGFIGTGRIGFLTARICSGFGCNILGHTQCSTAVGPSARNVCMCVAAGCDPYKNADFEKLGGKYVEMDELLATSDIISLHCPLTPESHHLINEKTIAKMKPGAVIVNTSRGTSQKDTEGHKDTYTSRRYTAFCLGPLSGPLIHSRDMIEGLKSGKVLSFLYSI